MKNREQGVERVTLFDPCAHDLLIVFIPSSRILALRHDDRLLLCRVIETFPIHVFTALHRVIYKYDHEQYGHGEEEKKCIIKPTKNQEVKKKTKKATIFQRIVVFHGIVQVLGARAQSMCGGR